MQAEAKGNQAALLVDKEELSHFINKYKHDSIAAVKDDFYLHTIEALKSIKVLHGIGLYDDTNNVQLNYKICLVAVDSAKNDYFIIASNDISDKYGRSAHPIILESSSSKRSFNINYSQEKQKNNFSDYCADIRDADNKLIAKIFVYPTNELIAEQVFASLKSGVKVSLIIFFLTFLIIFFSLRKLMKKEQKVKKTIIESKQLVEQKNNEMIDSINYAKRIQSAMLPSVDLIYKTLKQSFVLFKPKDVVSGDFYAFAEKNGKVLIAAVDCTGHGVPGAFMSMIGHNVLSQIIVERGITNPAAILDEMSIGVRKALKQEENQTRDGMDMALCCINLNTMDLEYAGANRPLWIIKANGMMEEIKANKQPIGGHIDQYTHVFTNHSLQLEKGDSIYIFSDGFVDQFGGVDEKKFMTKRFKETLINIQTKTMQEQGKTLDKVFEDWKGKCEQVDDVLVIGVKV
jgi:serine phosphatase RsbU (regulator of sigma subunit)